MRRLLALALLTSSFIVLPGAAVVHAAPQAKPACSDGIDNDGDGKIDYPADPGCTSKNDKDEADVVQPPPPPPPPTEPNTLTLKMRDHDSPEQPDNVILDEDGSGTEGARWEFTTENATGAECREGLDGGWFTCSSGLVYGFALGSHTVSVRATNGTQVDPTPLTVTFQVVSSAPPSGVCSGGTHPNYTTAASVDTARLPCPPVNPVTQNISSTQTISGAVADRIYNVVGPIEGAALQLTAGARLERVVLRANGYPITGINAGSGVLKDVEVSGVTRFGYGINTDNGARFEGVVYSHDNNINFRPFGSGLFLAPNAMMKSTAGLQFDYLLQNVVDSRFEGAMVSLGPNPRPDSTGWECWNDCHRNLFNIVISQRATGYGLAIYRSTNNTWNEFYGDGNVGFGDSDPAISIGGGASGNVVKKATTRRYTVAVIFGEDVDPAPHHNTVETLYSEDSAYGCVAIDRSAFSNIVGNVGGTTCIDSPWEGTFQPGRLSVDSVSIGNRVGIDPPQTGPQPGGNQVLGLNQSCTGQHGSPQYAVRLYAGTNGNVVTGRATCFSVARVRNDGSNTVNVTG